MTGIDAAGGVNFASPRAPTWAAYLPREPRTVPARSLCALRWERAVHAFCGNYLPKPCCFHSSEALSESWAALCCCSMSVWQPFSRFPINLPVQPDTSVYAVALLLALAGGLLCGAVPVRQVLRTDPYEIVKSGSLGRVGRRTTVRDLLLGVQIAICAVLVTSSMVAVRGLLRSLHSNFGFAPRNVMLVDTDLHMAGYRGDKVTEMQKRMIDAMQAIRGVTVCGIHRTRRHWSVGVITLLLFLPMRLLT